jgi:hypothetical protein
MGRFVAKGIVFAAGLAALLVTADALVASRMNWTRYEDPRARILWDGAFNGERIVLIGDSVFASLYVDSLTDALWAQLESHTGQPVFPGALNAARPPDVLAAATHVSKEWPAGTVVFISVPPTRFVVTRAEEPPAGNFADAYFRTYGIDATNPGALRRLQGKMNRSVLKPFFAARTRSALANLIDQPGSPRWMRNRVWSAEGEAAGELFQFFESHLVLGAGPERVEWLEQVHSRLQQAGMYPVFVLTPLNEALVHRFARLHSPDVIVRDLRRTVSEVRAQLDARRADVIDLTDGLPSECFFDLVHPNSCGDRLVATRLAEWLTRDAALEARHR